MFFIIKSSDNIEYLIYKNEKNLRRCSRRIDSWASLRIKESVDKKCDDDEYVVEENYRIQDWERRQYWERQFWG